mgnify:CR=1
MFGMETGVALAPWAPSMKLIKKMKFLLGTHNDANELRCNVKTNYVVRVHQ